MAVGVVAVDALRQPEDVGDAEAVAQPLRSTVGAARSIGIPIRVEQHGFGGEQLAVAVHFDRTAFEHQPPLERPGVEGLGDAAGMALSRSQGETSAPGVEKPVGDATSPVRAVFREDRSVIAAPDVVGRMIEERDGRCRRRSQRAAGESACWIASALIATHTKRLIARRVRRIGVARPDPPRPVLRVRRPGEPDRFVRLPFGRHAAVEQPRMSRRSPS